MLQMAHFRCVALLPLMLALPAWCASSDYETALARLKEGRPSEALPLLEAAHERQPSDPDVLYNLAGCYFALHRSGDGARAAEELARQNSRDPAVLLAAGSLLTEHGSPA